MELIIKYLRRVKGVYNKILKFIYVHIYKYISIDEHMIIFISFHGRSYSDNPRGIYEAMLKDQKFDDFQYIWFLKRNQMKTTKIPGKNVKIVKYFSIPYFYYLSKAKYWVINCKMPEYYRKKDAQIYLQTWHGAPLKRLAHEVVSKTGDTFYRSEISFEDYVRSYDVDAARYNYFLSPSPFSTEVFSRSFQISKDKILETGYPRTDSMVNATPQDIIMLKKKYHLPLNKKIILYAPTWRDRSYNDKGYIFELKADFKKWKEILGNEYIVVFKPHYLIINPFENDQSLNGFLYNISANADINDLYIVSDCFITDYSSSFFDYAISQKPIYFYMYDLEEYRDELRGIYLDVEKDLPGQIYKDEVEMIHDIKMNHFKQTLIDSFNKLHNPHTDGQCGKRVIDIIFKDL